MEADSGGSQSPPRAVELDGKVRQHLNLNYEFLQTVKINLFTVLHNNTLVTKILNGKSALFLLVS
jgi:hypothetical protein